MYRSQYDKKLKLWSGKALEPLYNPKISLGEIVLRALITNGSRIAQISDDSDIKMTFDEIRIKAIRAANNLQQLGYKPNNIFGFMARNSANVAPIAFASLFNGCPLNTLNPSFGNVELIHMLKTTKPCLMFCDLDYYDLVVECLYELEMKSSIFTFDGQKGDSKSVDSLFGAFDGDDDFLPVKVDGENAIAFIPYSSGTTGPPKSVCLSHASLANGIAENDSMNCDDVMLCFNPLDWISGVLTLLSGTIKGAKRIITTSAFSPELQFRMVKDYKITHILSPPNYVALSLKSDQLETADLSSVSCQIVGGSKVPIDLSERWNKYLKTDKSFAVAYGFTECGSFVSWVYPGSSTGTVGRLFPRFVAKIIGENGEHCGPNVDGEICIKSPHKFLGYFGNEKATKELFDSDGFMITGDIGHFDDDGNLYIICRKRDVLKYRNFQVTPGKIEDFLIQRPEIDSVCVVGIPDGCGSDLPAAVVIRSKNTYIRKDEVAELVADHFADFYKLRGGVYFAEEFPLTSSGKIIRRKVKDFAIESFQSEKSA